MLVVRGSEIGVFVCGPRRLSNELKAQCASASGKTVQQLQREADNSARKPAGEGVATCTGIVDSINEEGGASAGAGESAGEGVAAARQTCRSMAYVVSAQCTFVMHKESFG